MHLAIVLGFTGLLASVPSRGDELPGPGSSPDQPPCGDDPGLVLPAVRGATGLAVLSSAATYEGRVVDIGGGKLALKPMDDAGEILFLPASEVRGIVEVAVPPGTLPSGGPPEVRLVLGGGCVVGGRVVESAPGSIALESPGFGRREFPDSDVKRVVPLREAGRPETQARYLEAPSAMLMRAGEVQVVANEGTHLLAAVGVADFLSLEVGSVLPILHTERYGANGQAAVRAGWSVGLLHVAGGAHVSVSGMGNTSLLLSGTVTVGNPRASLTVHAGPMFPGANRFGDFGDVGVALAGSLRTPWLDVVAESWASRALQRDDAWLALAGRFRTRPIVWDVGLATAASRGQVLPWVGVTMDATLTR